MRVAAHRLAASLVSAGIAATALAPGVADAQTPGPATTTTQPAAPPTAFVPDKTAPTTTTPAPASAPAATTPAPANPMSPLDLTPPKAPHAVEDLQQRPQTTPSKPSEPAKAGTADANRATGTTAVPAAPAPPTGGPTAATLAAIPATAPAGVPSYFINSFRIPVFLLPIYQAAGTEYGVPWQVLAAINEIETDYGRNLSVSTAGAVGWMQFMPATWTSYGVDANRDGRADPYNPIDAIFAAARYLQAAGAQADLRKAIFAYNHADWYVDSVLERAQRLAALPADLVGALTGLARGRSPVLGRAQPLAALVKQSRSLRLSVRDGAPVVAVADARVVRIGYTPRLGRFVRLQDVFGNTYTYGRLASFSKRFPVLRPAHNVTAAVAAAATLSKAPDPAPTMPATAGTQPAAPAGAAAPASTPSAASAARAPSARSAPAVAIPPLANQDPAAVPPTAPGAPGAAITATKGTSTGPTVAANPAFSRQQVLAALAPLIPERTLGDPTSGIRNVTPAARVAGPLAALDWAAKARSMGIGLPVAAPVKRPAALVWRPTVYDRQLLGGVAASRVLYRPLREGSRVVAGTVLGRAASPVGRPARLRFEIRPAGKEAARIDPAPIVAGWKLLQASSGTASTLGLNGQPSIGQVLLLGKAALQRLVLDNSRITIYPCGREDIRAGRIDRRVLATLQLLAMSGLNPTVSALECGHSYLTTSGNVSEHSSGNAVDIAAINGIPILGHQGAGTITDTTIRKLLTLQGTMQPHQIISLMTYAGATNTLSLPDHADHIHVGFAPQSAPGSLAAHLFDGTLDPKAWQRLMDRLSTIDNPQVAATPSAAAIPAAVAAAPKKTTP